MGVRYIFGQDGAFRTEPVIVAKNITENGTYDPATEGADGYAPVVVNVEGGGSSWQTVFEGSVTTAEFEDARLEGLTSLTADTIRVTLNGTVYTCEKQADGSYGATYDESTQEFDFSEYPFNIGEGRDGYMLATQTAGTYTLKIEEPQGGGSSDFSTAEVTLVNSADGTRVVLIPVFYEASPPFSPDAFVTGVVNIMANETLILNVPLYKGHCSIVKGISEDRLQGVTVATSYTVTSGSATSSIQGVDITGDCTITIS